MDGGLNRRNFPGVSKFLHRSVDAASVDTSIQKKSVSLNKQITKHVLQPKINSRKSHQALKFLGEPK